MEPTAVEIMSVVAACLCFVLVYGFVFCSSAYFLMREYWKTCHPWTLRCRLLAMILCVLGPVVWLVMFVVHVIEYAWNNWNKEVEW